MAQQFRDAGFENAYALTGGFDAWQAAGKPLEAKEHNKASNGSGKQPGQRGGKESARIAAEIRDAQSELENE